MGFPHLPVEPQIKNLEYRKKKQRGGGKFSGTSFVEDPSIIIDPKYMSPISPSHKFQTSQNSPQNSQIFMFSGNFLKIKKIIQTSKSFMSRKIPFIKFFQFLFLIFLVKMKNFYFIALVFLFSFLCSAFGKIKFENKKIFQ